LKSVRAQLLVGLVLVLGVATMIAGYGIFRSALEEANELCDYELRAIALSLAPSVAATDLASWPDKDVEALKIIITRDLRVAWFEANNAFRRLDVTARLVEQSNQALRLAQARYDNGLGSIVELNEAQLNQTSAEITAASAKYEYLSRRAILDYTSGANR